MSMKLFAIFHSCVAFQHIYLHSICKLTFVQGVGCHESTWKQLIYLKQNLELGLSCKSTHISDTLSNK